MVGKQITTIKQMEEVILFETKEQLLNTVKNREVITIQISQNQYCVTRIGEDVYMFESKCPHFDHSMANAKISPNGQATCSWHNYQFDLTSGNESSNRCRNLLTQKANWNADGKLVVAVNQD